MASGYLHTRCAVLAAERASCIVTEDAYLFGSQGPDPLYMLGIFPLRLKSRPLPYGSMLHTARTGLFLVRLCALAKEKSEIEKAYAMGFLTHYALDSTVHPYVNTHSLDANGNYQSALHVRLENNWDALYSNRIGLSKTPDAQFEAVVNAKPCWEVVAALLSNAMLSVYPENPLLPGEILTAFQGVEKFGRLKRSRSIYGLAYLLERLMRKPMFLTAQFIRRKPDTDDHENKARKPWRSLSQPDRIRDEGLAELFETAVDTSCSLLRAADSFFAGELPMDTFAVSIGNIGYDTGVESLP